MPWEQLDAWGTEGSRGRSQLISPEPGSLAVPRTWSQPRDQRHPACLCFVPWMLFPGGHSGPALPSRHQPAAPLPASLPCRRRAVRVEESRA